MQNVCEQEGEEASGDDELVGIAPPAVGWTFLTNHSHVLICLFKEPDARLRDVAVRVGITERAVQRIVADLEEGGVLCRRREGRRNRYEIHDNLPLRHAIEAHCSVGGLLCAVAPPLPFKDENKTRTNKRDGDVALAAAAPASPPALNGHE